MSEFDSLFLSVCEGAMPTEALADWIGDRLRAGKQWSSTVVLADGKRIYFVIYYSKSTKSMWSYLTRLETNSIFSIKMFITLEEFMEQFPIWLRSALGDNLLGRTEETMR